MDAAPVRPCLSIAMTQYMSVRSGRRGLCGRVQRGCGCGTRRGCQERLAIDLRHIVLLAEKQAMNA